LLVVVVTLSLLMSLLLPAVQAAREATRNTQCINHLHQISDALHNYHDVHGALPAGWQPEPTGRSSYGWAARILRELEESRLYSQIDRSQPVDSVCAVVRSTTPAVYLCPSDPGEIVFPLYAELGAHGAHAQESDEVMVSLPRANYVGVFGTTDPDEVPGGTGDGAFIKGKGCRLTEMTRGLSHVIIIGERATRKLPSSWLGFTTGGEDAPGRLVGYADLGPNREDADECEFDSRHPGHANFTWADGHVAALADSLDSQVYKQLAQRR
jgi:prepilin-type processing-associated H-X9-DG protein